MADKPTIWIIPRSLIDYYGLKGLIGSEVVASKEQVNENSPTNEPDFKNIKQNDKVLLYVPSEGLIVDIFTVRSKKPKPRFTNYWRHAQLLIHNVESTLDLGKNKQFNFKKYARDNHFKFKNIHQLSDLDDMFYNSKEKGYLTLEEDEFNQILNQLNNPAYLTLWNTNPESQFIKEPEHLSALLDFYNSRTTSFANLLVASAFGAFTVVSLYNGFPDFSFYISILLGLIAIPIFYTLFSYCYYADMAEKIKSAALLGQCYKELNGVRVLIEKKSITRKREATYCNLMAYIDKKKKIGSKWLLIALILMIYFSIIIYVNFPTILSLVGKFSG
jgi:hypothetical protein